MPRKPLLLVIAFLALIEIAVLFTGIYGRGKPDPAMARKPVGPQDTALPYAVNTTPTLYVEPQAGFQWLYTLVAKAQSTIDITMYELADTTLSADLVQACQRGVKVRVILDGNLERASNTPAYLQLAAAGPNCLVAWANPQFPATHQKSLTLDGNTAVVMTANLTSRDYATSRDFALIDTDAADLNGIQTVFNKDFRSTSDLSFDPPFGHNLIWGPTSAEDDLVSLINIAKSNILLENEELGASSIVDALVAACRRGVHISFAMTDTSANARASSRTLEAAGCGVHLSPNNTGRLYIHANSLIADLGTATAVGYAGSINFSSASLTENRELGLYLHDPRLLAQIGAIINGDYNSFPAYR